MDRTIPPITREAAHKKLDELLDRAAEDKLHADVLAGLRLRDGQPQIVVYELRGTANSR